MHSLGFLKKKRTREANSDSQPTSPVTPTPTKQFESLSAASTAASTLPSAVAAAAAPSSSSPQSHTPPAQQPTPASHRELGAVGAESQQMSSSTLNPSPYPASYQTTNPVPESQNLPSIANLVNPTQPQQPRPDQPESQTRPLYPLSDSHSQPQQYPTAAAVDAPRPDDPQPTPSSLQSVMNPPQSASPALDQASQQQPPASSSAQPASAPTPQSQPQQQHVQIQLPADLRAASRTPIDASDAQARVTKGKYSLPDFDILRTLGTGSFGRVHLVQSKHNTRFYAIKVLKKAQVVRMKQVEHTNDERRMLGEVKHPFLVTLWGTFQDSKNLYMVMDFVEGGELFTLLRKSGRFPNPVAKFYAAEVTLALEYLHSKNIIYRDLKPENLLLDRHGHLKITDFGFAKRVPDKTWTLCGTPDYLAPEVVSNKGYNKSVDWWSLGILIYEMLCGYTPFWDSGSPMKIYENILRGKVKYPPYINHEAQDLLERLITADLTKRLGNLYGGSQDVKGHAWFAEVTWDRLARKDIDAPYTPPVKAGAGDASQFDRYPEDPEQYGQTGHDEFSQLFLDF